MKKKQLLTLILCTIFTLNVTTIISHASGNRYVINSAHLPAYNSYTYYKTGVTPANANTAISNAIGTWNAEISSMQFYLGSGTQSLNTSDSYNTVGSLLTADEFATVMGSYTYVAANRFDFDAYDRIKYSDIALNGSYSFNNGQYGSINDYQGIITHELGHTWGLGDVYESSEITFSSVNDLPTMFGNTYYSGYSGNVTIFLRDLKPDDINGLNAVKNLRGF